MQVTLAPNGHRLRVAVDVEVVLPVGRVWKRPMSLDQLGNRAPDRAVVVHRDHARLDRSVHPAPPFLDSLSCHLGEDRHTAGHSIARSGGFEDNGWLEAYCPPWSDD